MHKKVKLIRRMKLLLKWAKAAFAQGSFRSELLGIVLRDAFLSLSFISVMKLAVVINWPHGRISHVLGSYHSLSFHQGHRCIR